jgi:hypothetical protein
MAALFCHPANMNREVMAVLHRDKSAYCGNDCPLVGMKTPGPKPVESTEPDVVAEEVKIASVTPLFKNV